MQINKYFLILCLCIISIQLKAQVVFNENKKDTSFKVYGACEMCKERIENTLKIKGVNFAIWDIDSKILKIEFDANQISIEKIQNKILAVGHDLDNKKAKEIIYKNLPECCHYRSMPSDIMMDTVHNNIQGVKGVVLQTTSSGKFEPLANASVYWLGTTIGMVTDSFGVFNIPLITSTQRLVVSYIGYKADTITIINNKDVKIFLANKSQLNEVTVFSKLSTTYISSLNTIRTQIMTGKELLKAACCNLSESFETNPSVDVSYNDAVTGSKQIQLLGLSGNYTQLTVENLPGPRGLATPLGLNSIAGPWIESIQLTKGVGSVANGYESIAGQINVELKKPENAEKLLANVYINDFGKTDLNLNLSTKLNSNWSTGLLLHDNFLNNKNLDFNKDGFRDLPTGNQMSLINRYKFDNSKGVLAQFGVKVMKDDKVGGQIAFEPAKDKLSTNHYGLGIQTERYELFGKLGYVFPQQKFKSIGLQLAAIDHTQNSYFGLTTYDAKQQSFYGNLIYQSIINSTIHKFRTGFSFQYDTYKEAYKSINFYRKEIVPGAFFEYTFTPNEKISVVAGVRADNNNLTGAFVTPRLNIRYEPISGTVIRFSGGSGQRVANIFAENNSVLVSARQVSIISNTSNGNTPYGLLPEVAWNKGISIDQKFKLFNNNATIGFDYFRNDFTNQVVVDLENTQKIIFYNLKGKSYSNSVQLELNVIPIKKVEVKVAYRYFDVKQTYNGQLLERPYISKNRAFLSADYATSNKWKFNYTITYNGAKRITTTSMNPAPYQLEPYSPNFILMNAQVTKSFNNKSPMDLYVGFENAGNFFQQHPIVAAEQPFSPYFDSSMIWGPITGRMFYVGWRIKI